MLKKYIYRLVLPALTVLSGFSGLAQVKEFSVKEMVMLRNQKAGYFNSYAAKKGYVNATGKGQAEKSSYTFVFPGEKNNSLHTINSTRNERGTEISYSTTDEKDYDQIKTELRALHYNLTKSEPMHLNGRTVPLQVYTDGKNQVNMFYTSVAGENNTSVKVFVVKVN